MIGQALVLVVITTYNQHVRLLSSEPFGWLTPPKSTRAWEPTLLWNHYTSNQVVAVNGSLLQQSTTIGKFVLYRGKVLRVKKLFVRTVPPLVAALCAWAQPSNSPAPVEFQLYRSDETCYCVNTKPETLTIRASEKIFGKIAVQIFSPRNRPEQELFRVRIGKYFGSDMVKWWNYGIADEGDFNGDGKVDYAWYGGDDTSFVMYLFLSSDHGYTKVDILKTLEAAWKRRFHIVAPDFTETGGKYELSDVALRRIPLHLTLVARIKRMNPGGETTGNLTFKIEQADFKP